MKTAKVAAISAASIFAVVALLLAYPAMAATQPTAAGTATTITTPSPIIPIPTDLKVGQTITLTSTNGVWHLIGATASKASVKTGPASGSATLTVKGAFQGGYALTLTSGSIAINGTTYNFGTGSAEMGQHQAHLVGQGTLASATPGSFLFAAGAHANFQGQSYNTLRFDVQVNGQEYGVLLQVTAQVS